MKIKIWGARGSIPTPLKPEEIEEKICQAIYGMSGVDTGDMAAIRAYVGEMPSLLRGTAGGNTSCIEIQANGEIFIIDAGSGIRELGAALMQGPCGRGEGKIHLFFSHAHWDHIQGFPFFAPAFIPGNQILIYSIHNIEEVLNSQQRPINFPVDLSYMSAKLQFIPIKEGQPFFIGPVKINSIKNDHPGDAYSFRFEDQHSIFVYANDSEYKQLDDNNVQGHIEFFRDADALIFDAQYGLRETWETKVDWGHSSAMIGVDLARTAGVKRLILFHHEPTYSDLQLQQILSTAIAYQAQDSTGPSCEVIMAYEGLMIDLTPSGAIDWQLAADGDAAVLTPTNNFDEGGADRLTNKMVGLGERISLAGSVIDFSQVETLTTASLKSLLDAYHVQKAAPIVLAAPSPKVQRVIKLGGYADYFAIYPTIETALVAIQARKALNLPGQIVKDRFKIEEKLGEGRIGTVLKVTDTHYDRIATLKLFAPTFSRETVLRFERQAQQIVTLDHRNIAKVYDWGQEGEHFFIVEEFITGQTLQERIIGSQAPPSSEEALDIFRSVALALEYTHRRGVIHGNLKPHNIFLSDPGTKLKGVGLGRLEEGRNLLEVPLIFSTPAYLAPEQILGQSLDARTDLYALGVILYQLFVGQLPFDGSDEEMMQAHLDQIPPMPRDLNPQLSRSVEHLIMKLLAKNPNDRYASIQQARWVARNLRFGSKDTAYQSSRTFIGRTKEVQALQTCWQEACNGHGQLALISGEGGIGKSSLAEQLAARSETKVLLLGRCHELEGSPAYHPFTEALQTYFSMAPPEFFDEETRHLLSNFGQLVPEIRQVLTDLPIPPQLEPKQDQLRLMSSLTQFIRRATQERPWLLILDDLQWADQSSLELLRYLGRHLPTMSLLLVGIYRDVELERGHPLLNTLRDLSRNATYHQYTLNRLSKTDVGQILADIWKHPIPSKLIEKIYQQTEGNPFYVEELAQGLIDDGLISFQNGAWHFPEIEAVRLPQSIRDTVERRIRHLSPDTRDLLCRAAVFGPAFSFDDLLDVSGLSAWQVLEHLDLALERQLVQEVPGSENVLRFSHTEIHQIIYDELGKVRRRVLHRQAGEALERHRLPNPEDISEKLAYHFSEAGEFEKAIIYSIQAANQARTAYANETALLWYNRALDLVNQLDPIVAAQFQSWRLSIFESLGELLQLLGQLQKADTLYQEALRLAEQIEDQSQQAWFQTAMAELRRKQGLYHKASTWLDKARRNFEALQEQEGIAQVLRYEGILAARQGDYEKAQGCYEKSLTIRRQLQDNSRVAGLLSSLGTLAEYRGEAEVARQLYEESLQLRRGLGDKLGIASSLNNLGNAVLSQGDTEAARTLLEEALTIRREAGDRWAMANSLNNLGNVLREQGDLEAAQQHYKESLLINRELEDKWAIAYLLEDVGHLALLEKRFEQGLWLFGAAQTLRDRIGSPLPPTEQAKQEIMVASAQKILGKKITASAMAAGRTTPLPEAIAAALQMG